MIVDLLIAANWQRGGDSKTPPKFMFRSNDEPAKQRPKMLLPQAEVRARLQRMREGK